MLPVHLEGESGPLLVLLHWLGGSAASWTEVSHGLAERGLRCAALDLPGFGNADDTAGFDVAAMSELVIQTIRFMRAQGDPTAPWLLAGHSMGGKVAAVITQRALRGEAGLEGLRGLVLVSPSPTSPEPMPDSKREEMLSSLGESTGDPKKDRNAAANFVDQNTGKLPLLDAVHTRAVDGVLKMNRTAFRHWLERGSKEDWSERIGKLELPALVFAGEEDAALGPDAQQAKTMPHLPQGELITLEATGHLAPLERPGELIEIITQFLARLELQGTDRAHDLTSAFTDLLASEKVSPKTREVLQARLQTGNWRYQPQLLQPAEFRILRAVAGRIVPGAGVDLAAILEAQLAAHKTDGWRFAVLPPDGEAWAKGLRSFDLAARRAHGVGFVALHPDQQDALLQQAAEGELGKGLLGAAHLGDSASAYAASEMKSWFEDVRAECARHYMGDPLGYDRVRYTGFADDIGFTQIQLGQQGELL